MVLTDHEEEEEEEEEDPQASLPVQLRTSPLTPTEERLYRTISYLTQELKTKKKEIVELRIQCDVLTGKTRSRKGLLQEIQNALYNEIFSLQQRLTTGGSGFPMTPGDEDATTEHQRQEIQEVADFIRDEFAKEKVKMEKQQHLAIQQLEAQLNRKWGECKVQADFYQEQYHEVRGLYMQASQSLLKQLPPPPDVIGKTAELSRTIRGGDTTGAQVQGLKEEIRMARKECSLLNDKADKMRLETATAAADKNSALQHAAVAHDRLIALEKEMAALTKESQGTEKKMAESEAELNRMKGELVTQQNQLEEEKQRMKAESDRAVGEITAKLVGMQKYVKELERYLDRSIGTERKKASNLQVAKMILEERVKSLKEDCLVMAETNRAGHSEVQRKLSEVERQTEADVKELTKQLHALRRERDAYKSAQRDADRKWRHAASQLERLRSAADPTAKALRDLKSQTERHYHFMAELEMQVQVATERSEAIQALNDILAEKCRCSEGKIREYEAQIEELQSKQKMLTGTPMTWNTKPLAVDMNRVPTKAVEFFNTLLSNADQPRPGPGGVGGGETPITPPDGGGVAPTPFGDPELDAACRVLSVIVQKAGQQMTVSDIKQCAEMSTAKKRWADVENSIRRRPPQERIVGRAQLLLEKMTFRHQLLANKMDIRAARADGLPRTSVEVPSNTPECPVLLENNNNVSANLFPDAPDVLQLSSDEGSPTSPREDEEDGREEGEWPRPQLAHLAGNRPMQPAHINLKFDGTLDPSTTSSTIGHSEGTPPSRPVSPGSLLSPDSAVRPSSGGGSERQNLRRARSFTGGGGAGGGGVVSLATPTALRTASQDFSSSGMTFSPGLSPSNRTTSKVSEKRDAALQYACSGKDTPGQGLEIEHHLNRELARLEDKQRKIDQHLATVRRQSGWRVLRKSLSQRCQPLSPRMIRRGSKNKSADSEDQVEGGPDENNGEEQSSSQEQPNTDTTLSVPLPPPPVTPSSGSGATPTSTSGVLSHTLPSPITMSDLQDTLLDSTDDVPGTTKPADDDAMGGSRKGRGRSTTTNGQHVSWGACSMTKKASRERWRTAQKRVLDGKRYTKQTHSSARKRAKSVIAVDLLQ